VRTIRLDATPLGEPLYRKLGFEAQYELGRFAIRASFPRITQTHEPPAPREEWPACCRLDQIVTNTDRSSFLLALFAERPQEVRVIRRGGAVVGFVTARRGCRAWKIGPCIATSEAGPLLLEQALRRFHDRPAYLDIPLTHQAAKVLVTQAGSFQQRTLLRMCRGEPVVERVEQLWASSGPEKG
jgi:hypothetical protein